MVKKPRPTRYGKAHAVRFKKRTDGELTKICIDNPDLTKSDIIQSAVECYLFNRKCKAKEKRGGIDGC